MPGISTNDYRGMTDEDKFRRVEFRCLEFQGRFFMRNTHAHLHIVAAAMIALAGSAAANDGHIAEKSDVQLQIHRLWAVTEVQNLLGTYSYWHTSGFNFRVPELYTKTDDTVIEMMWGRYTGKDAAYRVYVVDHRRDDQGAIDALGLKAPAVEKSKDGAIGGAATAGGPSSMAPFHLHTLTTPVIQIAGDGQTARAVWISPGIEGSGWGWCKYAADFKFVGNQWKIWHLHVYGLFMTGYDKSWAGNAKKITPTTPGQHADKPPTTNWEYYQGATYVPLQPEPPQPYETWNVNMIPASYGSTN
jgi:SnoaL-like domain